MWKRSFSFLALFCLPLLATADPITEILDLPAGKWRESPAINNKMEKHTGKAPLRITVHFTDVAKNFSRPLRLKLQSLFEYATTKVEGSKRKIWGDIPYHFYIDANGLLAEARSTAYQPDSNTTYSRDGHLTVVLEGDSDDGITPAQRRKLFRLLAILQKKFKIPAQRIGVHKQYAQTDCPGPAITKAVDEYKKSREALK